MFNKTREIYKKITNGGRPSEEKLLEIIQASEELKSLLTHPGWKRVQKFINTQKEGSKQYMEHETQNIGLIGIVWLFNTFVKYLFVLLENRAYNRIETYIKVTIQNGQRYAEQRSKAGEPTDQRAA